MNPAKLQEIAKNLRERARIRLSAKGRKSVEENAPDRLAIQLIEAADAVDYALRVQDRLLQIKNMHARILSWPPQEVQEAYAVIMQAGSYLARNGKQMFGAAVGKSLDTVKRYVRQEQANASLGTNESNQEAP